MLNVKILTKKDVVFLNGQKQCENNESLAVRNTATVADSYMLLCIYAIMQFNNCTLKTSKATYADNFRCNSGGNENREFGNRKEHRDYLN